MTLAQQLATLPGFRWAAGMRVLAASDTDADTDSPPINTVVDTRDGTVTVAWSTFAGTAEGGTLLRDDVPDLADNATGGVLLGWLASMGMQPTADCDAGRWDVGAGKPTEWRWHGPSATLGEACAKALIALGRAS